MRISKWIHIAAVLALCCTGAMADHGHDNNNNKNNNNGVFASSIVGSVPGATVGGVNSGGVPWTVTEGKATLSGSGKLNIEVQGLLIIAGPGVPANLVGTTGPVQMVAGSLVCGGSGGTVVATTGGVPLSGAGNAEIEASITLPSSCMAPVVLVRFVNAQTAQAGPFIALTGLNSGANAADNDDHDR